MWRLNVVPEASSERTFLVANPFVWMSIILPPPHWRGTVIKFAHLVNDCKWVLMGNRERFSDYPDYVLNWVDGKMGELLIGVKSG